MADFPYAARDVGVDSRVLKPAALYRGGLMLATSGGAATVAVYDGIDATGELIDYFSAAASGKDRNYIGPGIILKHGLYVDIGSNVSKFTIFYEPEPRALG